MSKDRYSDDHTIEILQENSFIVNTDNGNINLITEGDDGDIKLETGASGESGGNIYLTTTGDTGNIEIEAESGIATMTAATVLGLYAGMSNVILKSTSGSITAETENPDKEILILTNGHITNPSQIVFDIETDTGSGTTESVFSVDAEGDVECGDITCDSINTEGDVECGDITCDSINIDGSSELSGLVDWSSLRESNFEFTVMPPGGEDSFFSILKDSGSGMANDGWFLLGEEDGKSTTARLFAAGHIGITTSGIDLISAGVVSEEQDGDIVLYAAANGAVRIIGQNSSTHSYVCEMSNLGGISNEDILNLDFENQSTPDHSNNWIRFTAEGSSMGGIQGASQEDGVDYGVAIVGEFDGEEYVTIATDPGHAQFVSGSADFGEFFEAGDLSEWKGMPRDPTNPILKIPEGIIVWVIGQKFYRKKQNNIGVPMLVTKRSIIVGSGTALLKGHPDARVGAVLSFVGQLPVFVKGKSNVGDLLIPVDDEFFCKCISKEDATLQDYMAALGTSLQSCEEEVVLPPDHPRSPGEKVDMHRLWCAVGVK